MVRLQCVERARAFEHRHEVLLEGCKSRPSLPSRWIWGREHLSSSWAQMAAAIELSWREEFRG